MNTQNVINSTNSLVSALDIVRRETIGVEVLHARAAQDAAVITVATVEQARSVAWHLAATHSVRARRFGYAATLRTHTQDATPVIIEADGRPEVPAL